MQMTVNAVEAFRRARMVDGVTSDDDKVAPVYKMEEIIEILQQAPTDVVHEMTDYLLKSRMEHRSPNVRLKTLRLIKFSLPKAGKDFKREVQRHSFAMKALFYYKGLPDALKGDAINRAVREMSHEVSQLLFTQDDDKNSSHQNPLRKLQAFGGGGGVEGGVGSRGRGVGGMGRGIGGSGGIDVNTVMEFGQSTIAQGLSMMAGRGAMGHSFKPRGMLTNSLHSGKYAESENDGRYEGPTPRDTYESGAHYSDPRRGGGYESYRPREEAEKGNGDPNPWDTNSQRGETNGGRGGGGGRAASEEERLVEAITAQGGVRSQPSREMTHAFLGSIARLDGVAVGGALERRLVAHSWQVKLKAVGVLDAVLRNEGDAVCDTICAFFQEDATAVLHCLESPQASLREKAKRVMELLGMGENQHHQPASATSAPTPPPLDVPDLLDTSAPDPMVDLLGGSGGGEELMGGAFSNPSPQPSSDPFASVPPSGAEGGGGGDLFSGLELDQADLVGRAGAGGLFEGMSLSDSGARGVGGGAEALADLLASPPSASAAGAGSGAGGGAGVQDIGSFPGLVGLGPGASIKSGMGMGTGMGMGMGSGSGAVGWPGMPAGVPMPGFNPQMMPGLNPAMQHQILQHQLMVMQAMGAMGAMGATPNGGMMGQGGGGGTAVDGFDFSSEPKLRVNHMPEAKKENDTKAFDFVSEHMKTSLRRPGGSGGR